MIYSKGTLTFVFSSEGFVVDQDIFNHFELLKESKKFLEFLRFFFIDLYTYQIQTSPEKLISKLLVLTKYQEIPLKLFIEHLLTEKKIINTNKHNKIYCQGINIISKENIIELYYIAKCREYGDDDNFISHVGNICNFNIMV